MFDTFFEGVDRGKGHYRKTFTKEMHESLTLSLSQRANHLTTHFYNAQESYIDYTRSAKDTPNNPDVFFKPTRQGNTITYTPRAHIWDLNGGFGALGQFEYFQQSHEGQDSAQQVATRERVQKAEYQKALDEGKPLPKLTTENTKYWSDYSRVIFEPKSYNVIQHWEFDPVKYPRGRLALGQEREFVGHDVGVEEWNNEHVGVNFLEDKYRVSLEECDLLNGVNVVTEIDSAWGGFSSSLLSELRDDYNPKSSLFTWALYNGKATASLSAKETVSRISTFLELHKNSSLFIPLGTPKNLPESFTPTSIWQTSALQSLVFESVQLLNSQRVSTTNMHTIESNITLGTNRRLVSSVTASAGSTTFDFATTFFPQKKEPHTFSQSTISRPSQSASRSASTQKDSPCESIKDKSKIQYRSSIPFPTPDSFPTDIISTDDKLSVNLFTTSAPRKSLQGMKRLVSKLVRGDERADLINELETLASEYEYGWTDSDEESDDDY